MVMPPRALTVGSSCQDTSWLCQLAHLRLHVLVNPSRESGPEVPSHLIRPSSETHHLRPPVWSRGHRYVTVALGTMLQESLEERDRKPAALVSSGPNSAPPHDAGSVRCDLLSNDAVEVLTSLNQDPRILVCPNLPEVVLTVERSEVEELRRDLEPQLISKLLGFLLTEFTANLRSSSPKGVGEDPQELDNSRLVNDLGLAASRGEHTRSWSW